MADATTPIESAAASGAPTPAAEPAPRPRTRSRKGDTGADADAEVHALSQCIRLLTDLDEHAQCRVLMYLNRRFVPMREAVPGDTGGALGG